MCLLGSMIAYDSAKSNAEDVLQSFKDIFSQITIGILNLLPETISSLRESSSVTSHAALIYLPASHILLSLVRKTMVSAGNWTVPVRTRGYH